MKIIVQRVSSASVTVEQQIISRISKGLMLLVCCEKADDLETVEKAAQKILALRIFADEKGRMNLNLGQVSGEVLAVSQFTLSWDGRKGNRPSFDLSMEPSQAEQLFDKFTQILEKSIPCQRGAFGKNMDVSLVNDGPVTFSLSF